MADYAPPGDRLRIAGRGLDPAPDTAQASALRCQWCSVPLMPGVTICPTCGSPGIPDPRMTVAGLNDSDVDEPEPASEEFVAHPKTDDTGELVEWWREESKAADTAHTREQLSYEEVEQRQVQTLAFIGIAVVVCAVLGWIIGPALLEGPIESLTGTPVEQRSDLRGMGTFIGLIVGMFIGATGGWVIWASR